MPNSILSYLRSRRLLKQSSSENLPELLVVYNGFDATAQSLHIGHLIVLKILSILKEFGHKTIGLIGSGTTLLGDPTWKSESRPMLSKHDIAVNAAKLKAQIIKLSNPDYMVDNIDWFGQIRMLEFMRDVASYFSVNQLTSMETFSARLRDQKHLSAMEFYYPLLQAYDFKHLLEHYNSNVQLGGSDQWGNITQGIGFVSRTTKQEVFGLVADLLVNSSGEKMGKSVSGAIYLDEKLCSPYDFWQFWRNVADDDVERFMLQLTSFTEDEIKSKLSNITDAKKALADSITTWVHGAENAIDARTKSEMIFEKNVYDELETFRFEESTELEKLLVKVGFATSFGEAKRTIESGAIHVDDTKILSPKFKFDSGEYVIRYGKKRYVRVVVG
jgi:tyrosyl-tRNA synthetase